MTSPGLPGAAQNVSDEMVEAAAMALYIDRSGEQMTSWGDGAFMQAVRHQYLRSARIALDAALSVPEVPRTEEELQWVEDHEWAVIHWRAFIASRPDDETLTLPVPAGTSQGRIDRLQRIADKVWGGRYALRIEVQS